MLGYSFVLPFCFVPNSRPSSLQCFLKSVSAGSHLPIQWGFSALQSYRWLYRAKRWNLEMSILFGSIKKFSILSCVCAWKLILLHGIKMCKDSIRIITQHAGTLDPGFLKEFKSTTSLNMHVIQQLMLQRPLERFGRGLNQSFTVINSCLFKHVTLVKAILRRRWVLHIYATIFLSIKS